MQILKLFSRGSTAPFDPLNLFLNVEANINANRGDITYNLTANGSCRHWLRAVAMTTSIQILLLD